MSDKAIVFYDGTCALCNGLVRWLVEHDRHARLLFAPLQGITFKTAFSPEQITAFPDSVIVRTHEGKTLVRTATTIYMLRQLGGVWSVLAAMLWLVPRPLRDAVYQFVQHRRKRWYGEVEESCPAVSMALRQRFLK